MPNNNNKEDSWFGVYWRPAAAIVYLVICMFDFVVYPTYINAWSDTLPRIVATIKDLPPESQSIVLTNKLVGWEPLTLKGSGLFHVAFGAILGASVWTRGQERVSEIKYGNYDDYYETPPRGRPGRGSINNQNDDSGSSRGDEIDNPG